MALETRFYWHVSVLVKKKKKKKDSFRARVIPILHLFLHTPRHTVSLISDVWWGFVSWILDDSCQSNILAEFLTMSILESIDAKWVHHWFFLLLKFSSWLGDERSIFSATNLCIITLVFWEEGVSLFVCWLVLRWLGGW